MKPIIYITTLLILISCNGKNNIKESEKVQPMEKGEYDNLNEGESLITGGAKFQNLDAENLYWQAMDLIKAKNKKDALTKLENALESEPNNLTILESIANLKGELGELTDAIEIFESILVLDSTKYSTNLNLGLTYFFNGNYKNSLQQFDKVILNSKDSNQQGIAYFHKSEIFLKMNECVNAEKSLELADSFLKSETIRMRIEELRNNIKKDCR